MHKHNKITETIGQAAVVAILIVALIFALKNWASTSYVTYYEGNDGYYPVEFTPCEVVSVRETETEREITVAYKGNEYAYRVEKESEINKGNVIWCGFASYEGNLEFIDILE